MTEWQPIETAPNDGKHVLLYVQPFEFSVGDNGFGFTAPTILTGYFDQLDANWCATTSGWRGPFLQPTHWMPLPDKPAD